MIRNIPNKSAAVVPSDVTNINASGLYVGGAGNVNILFAGDSVPVLWENVPAGSTKYSAIGLVQRRITL